MRWAGCSTHEKFILNFSRKIRREYMENAGVDGKIDLDWINLHLKMDAA
jgi:hypothetical protein